MGFKNETALFSALSVNQVMDQRDGLHVALDIKKIAR
jgi:hypothetical protein